MSPRTLRELMAFPWIQQIEADPDGGFRLSVNGLYDFELFAESQEELDASWKEALESHLAGYLAVGKAVPIPGAVCAIEASDTRGVESPPMRIVLNGRFELVG